MISRFFYKISPRGQMDCLDFQGDWPLLEHSVGKHWGLGKLSNFWIWFFLYHLKTHCCYSSMSWVYEYHKHLFSAATYGLGVLIHPCHWQRRLTICRVVYLMRSVNRQGYILQGDQSWSPSTTLSIGFTGIWPALDPWWAVWLFPSIRATLITPKSCLGVEASYEHLQCGEFSRFP